MSFEVTPDVCYEITDVKVDEISIAPKTFYYFPDPIKENHKIEAEFVKISYDITVTAEGHGSILPADGEELQDGKIAVDCGESQTFEFVPETGYEVAEVRVNGQIKANPGTRYTFENVTADNRIFAIFECKADSSGDINGDAKTDLTDAILGLQLICKKETKGEISLCADVNLDEKIGLEEVIYILGIISGD